MAIPPHEHSARLCAVCMTAKLDAVRRAPGARVNAYVVAERIRRDRGRLWGAVREFGISYSHAAEIRSGWRGAGRTAPAIPYAVRGWTNGRHNGWSTRPLVVLHGAVRVTAATA